jgi:hypothetical protein
MFGEVRRWSSIDRFLECRQEQAPAIIADQGAGKERRPSSADSQPAPPIRAMLIPMNAAADVIASER